MVDGNGEGPILDEATLASVSQDVTNEINTKSSFDRRETDQLTDPRLNRTRQLFKEMIGIGGPLKFNEPIGDNLNGTNNLNNDNQPLPFEERQIEGLPDVFVDYEELLEEYTRQKESLLEALNRVDEDENKDELRKQLFPAIMKSAVISLQKEQQIRDLEKKIYEDPLTKTLNQAYFLDRLPGVIDEKLKEERKIATVMVDIDNFKLVNDTDKHEKGDMVLQEVAFLFETNLRGHDIVVRQAGDEFMILLDGITQNQAMTVAERLRKAIEKRSDELKSHGELTVGFSASIGVAIADDLSISADELLRRTDTAMYNSKQTKNTVSLYNPDMIQPPPTVRSNGKTAQQKEAPIGY